MSVSETIHLQVVSKVRDTCETAVALEDIEDVEKFCRIALTQLPPGMFLRPGEREDELQECIVKLYQLHRAWDAARTPSFEQFARYQLVRFYVRGELPRCLAGRKGAQRRDAA
jgi:hypothetical protein